MGLSYVRNGIKVGKMTGLNEVTYGLRSENIYGGKGMLDMMG